MVLISANSLVTLYLGVELLGCRCTRSSRSIAIPASQPKRPSSTSCWIDRLRCAALRHVDHLRRHRLARTRCHQQCGTADAGGQIGLLFGLAFIVVGVAFKFGAVPFHTWVPMSTTAPRLR